MADLLQEKEVTVPTQDGGKLTVFISKFPAVAGREIITQYPTSGAPKIGDYAKNEELMYKLLNYVAVQAGDNKIRLSTKEMVNNHIPDWEALAHIEKEMLVYNCSFFQNGEISGFFETISQKASDMITSILTDLLAQSSKAEKPASTNSQTSTH